MSRSAFAMKAARSSFEVVLAGRRIEGIRVPAARHLRVRVPQLRRHHVRVAFADEHQRLAAFLERTHVHDERLDRGERDLVADPLHGFCRVVGVPYLELVLRGVIVLAPEELLQAPHDSGVIPRHSNRGGRFERVHDADHVRGTELGVDELHELVAHRQAGARPHVVVVQKDREQPHVVASCFRFLVRVRANRLGGLLEGLRHSAVELHQLEGFNLLRLAVLGDLEIPLLEVAHRGTVLVGEDDVDANEVDAGAKHRRRLRRLVRRRLLGGRRLSARRRRRFGGRLLRPWIRGLGGGLPGVAPGGEQARTGKARPRPRRRMGDGRRMACHGQPRQQGGRREQGPEGPSHHSYYLRRSQAGRRTAGANISLEKP